MRGINLYVVFLTIFIVSCTASENEDKRCEDSLSTYSDLPKENNYFILVIGNSLSRDAFSYVPAIMADACDGKHFQVTILYRGNKSLSDHWNSINNEISDYTLDTYDNDNSKWQTNTKVLAKDIIISKKWDLVVLQEGSGTARSYDLTQPSVHHIAGYIQEIQPNVIIAFMINPPHADGYSDLGERTSNEVWMQYVQIAQQLLDNNEIDYVIPCGTGIQNARHTYLDSLGVYGHLSYDGRHLQEGIPCVTDAYTASQSLFNLLKINASINNSSLRITQQWVDNCKIPGQHGKVIEGTDEDYNISKKCAINAVDRPFEQTFDEETASIHSPRI